MPPDSTGDIAVNPRDVGETAAACEARLPAFEPTNSKATVPVWGSNCVTTIAEGFAPRAAARRDAKAAAD